MGLVSRQITSLVGSGTKKLTRTFRQPLPNFTGGQNVRNLASMFDPSRL